MRAVSTPKAKRRERQRFWRESVSMQNFKHEMHCAAIAQLWRHYHVVVCSNANFGAMCRRRDTSRPFGAWIAQQALSWGHGAFRRRLQWSAEGRSDRHVVVREESYTTRTCGLCGTMNHAVGRSTEFRCVNPQCLVVIDRDVNGARNLLLKDIQERQLLHQPLPA